MPAENFADKWALYPKRRDAFFSWMQRARRELIDEPLQSLGIDQLKKHYSAVLGEAPVTRAIKALGAETRIKSEKNTLYSAGLVGGLSSSAAAGNKQVNSATREMCLATAKQELTEEEYDKLTHLLSASKMVDTAILAGQSQG